MKQSVEFVKNSVFIIGYLIVNESELNDYEHAKIHNFAKIVTQIFTSKMNEKRAQNE